MTNVVKITSAADARLKKDEALAEKLSLEVTRHVGSIGSILSTGAQQIESQEELKRLLEDVKALIYDGVLDMITEIEVRRNLDRVLLKEVSLGVEGDDIINVDSNI